MVTRHAGVAGAGAGFRRAGEQVFEEHLAGSDGDSVWVRVSLGPLAERGEQRAMAYVLFISRPDVETVDHEEVRRLRKSLQLLADTQTDYVVEVDREAMMTFVSPSFCRALGASEQELIGKPFAGRVLAADQAGVAAAIGQALRPPFAAGMQARLAAVPGTTVTWQLDAVIGDGVVGLDIVGRLEKAGLEAPPAPAPGAPPPPRRSTRGSRRSRAPSRCSSRVTRTGSTRWRAPSEKRPEPSACRTLCAAATRWRRRSAGACLPPDVLPKASTPHRSVRRPTRFRFPGSAGLSPWRARSPKPLRLLT